MSKICDNKSVGVIVTDVDGRYALLKRANFPIAIAPIAGHIDNHGTAEQAAVNEAEEELGLTIEPSDLALTTIAGRRVENHCRREGGNHHVWSVFEANQFLGDITPDPDETQGARWYTKKELQKLADRTKAYKAGKLSETEWQQNPGLEAVWLDFMTELGHVK